MNPDWSVEAHVGVGRLRFGLTPEAVSATASVYGSPTPMIKGSDAASDVAALMADMPELGLSLSVDELAALQQSTAEQANLDRQNLEKDRTAVLLEYRDGRLDGVTVEARHAETAFEGRRVFAMDPIEVLRLFERANGEPGRYRHNEAAFDRLAVSLFAFSHARADGHVRPATKGDRDFRARSLTLRRQPYKPAGELDQFVTASFE
ncbi:hypothetical protein [Aureimonas jatrophae]|nr:hypothetical protein [Aureimonas jatrophae]MBB3951616.1 hypothetical protein [Aureimonas jatrophae]